MSQEYDIQELEEQEWDFDNDDQQQLVPHEFMDGTEIDFLVQDPEPEVITQLLSPAGEDTDRSEVLFQFNQKCITAPELTLERWRQMRSADKLALSNKVSEAVGVDQVLDFPDSSLEEELDDLLSE